MKKLTYILMFLMTSVVCVSGQTIEKIKGNRNVTIKQTYIDDFETIRAGDDFSIDIVYNSKPSVEIEADDNLHDVILFEVVNGVLNFSINKNITSKKTLKIVVNYGDALKRIELHNDAEIRSLTSMELENASLITSENAKAYLNINTKKFDYQGSGKSKTRLNLNADSTSIALSDNSKLDGRINSKDLNFSLEQRAFTKIEGICTTALIKITDNADFKGDDFEVKQCEMYLTENSDLAVSVTDEVILDATGSSEVYLYGNPKIIITRMEGTTKLQKKEH